MATLRQTVKNTALRSLRTAGLFRTAADSERRNKSLLILCYHGISLQDEHDWAGHLFITPQRFRERLACLKNLNASVLPLEEAFDRLQKGTLPPRSVAITFDDGFYDFLRHATPILNEFGMPGTLYLTTHYSGLRFPIITLALDYLLWKSRRSLIEFPEWGIPGPVAIATPQQRAEAVRRMLGAFETAGLDTSGKNEAARLLARRLGIDYDQLIASRLLQIMTPEEAASVARSGIDIQLHTHRHRTPRDHHLFLREIHDNRTRIAEITGREASHFCYPSGVYADQFLPWLRECGVKTATTCDRGFAQSDSDPLLLPRVLDDSNMDIVQFEAFVSGFLRT